MLYDISTPTKLMVILNKVEKSNWQDMDDLYEISDQDITNTRDATRICQALAGYMSTHDDPIHLRSHLPTLISFFQYSVSPGATNAFTKEGLPLLRELIRQSMDEGKGASINVMFVLRVLASYQQAEDVAMVARLANAEFCSDREIWSPVFCSYADEQSQLSVQMVDALRDLRSHPIILIAYLDAVNEIAQLGIMKNHPFNTELGLELLRRWLNGDDKSAFYAYGATAALPFISKLSRAPLFELALEHPNVLVKLQAAWLRAELGDKNGVNILRFYSLAPQYSLIAESYLFKLGLLTKIPVKTRAPEFRARAIMANWLLKVRELDYPPDRVDVIDHRQLFWPPTHDVRNFWLVKFMFEMDRTDKNLDGVGLVGFEVREVFGEESLSLSAEELYGLSCARVSGYARNTGVNELQKEIEYGMALLREHNEGF